MSASSGGPAAQAARRRTSADQTSLWRLLLFGRPISTDNQDHARLRKLVALPVFSSDAISSVAYAGQQILLALGAAGLWTASHRGLYNTLTLSVTGAIIALLFIVVASYRQTIFAYPSGGGSYIVSKENLGTSAGLIAGAALLVDYVLTVAVSIAAGVQNLLATPLLAGMADRSVAFCVGFIVLLTLANLRGLRESGTVFAFPTYFFVAMALVMIVVGLTAPWTGWVIHRDTVNQTIPGPPVDASSSILGFGLILLVMKAFANGCAAMTGTEAISNTVPAFRTPQPRNAAITLVWMAVILAVLFGGLAWLTADLHVVYFEDGKHRAMPVIDQLSGAVFGKTSTGFRLVLYYCMQMSTTVILVLAANTSFAGFPGLASIMARDRVLPRQLANRGDKLVYSNGIVLLGLAAGLLVVAFHGSVDSLIPLYAVGVFTAFTLSQSGMVRHWKRDRTIGWRRKAAVNFFGAVCTGIVLLVIAIEKAPEGAWLAIVVVALLYAMFRAIYRHYERLRRDLSIRNWTPDPQPLSNTVLLLVPSLHRGVFAAMKYATSLSPDCRGIYIEVDPTETPRLLREWEEYVGEALPLVVLPSPFRSIVGPLRAYMVEVLRERENHTVTVVVPEFVPGKWYHAVLHNANGFLIKYYLGNMPGVVVSNVRYFLPHSPDAPAEPCDPPVTS